MSSYIILQNKDVPVAQNIASEIIDENGKLKILSFLDYIRFEWEDFRIFCHEYARYGIPTIELIKYLKDIIGNRSAIEIGAGSGDLGYRLGIPMTDSKIQEDKKIQIKYKSMGQPIIKYGYDVEKMDALEAVKKYKPQVVIASWVTTYSSKESNYGSSLYGVREKEILDLIETYILIGSLEVHGDKPIRDIPHDIIDEPFIISRNKNTASNRIFIWNMREELNKDRS